MTDVLVYGLALAKMRCAGWTRSYGEIELLSWTTAVEGGFADCVGCGGRASCAGFLGCCGCCSRCRGLWWGLVCRNWCVCAGRECAELEFWPVGPPGVGAESRKYSLRSAAWVPDGAAMVDNRAAAGE